ncbi:hypothetical protein Leryth_004800 [Lithospermum erythrorhizon]|nr:hypothetical protein Leryth_004800 [Lithospermum erythrorhizon]
MDTKEIHNHEAIVRALYKALASGDKSRLEGLIASDLEWWFHGPHNCHFMMKMLTSGNSCGDEKGSFKFEPRSINRIDECVIVEGWEGAEVYWVHVWTVEDGMIILFREYFNTCLTVKDVNPHQHGSFKATSTLWQSHFPFFDKRSLPGLMLAL